MKIDDHKIDELAQLARLEFKAEDKLKIKTDLERILDFCNKLNQLDTTDVEPLVYMSDSHNVLREDEASSHLSKEQSFRNAPSHDSDYFKVPKVIKK
ncbi:MAG: Asp-tRNA(Asn)/Glu-tRNA(Gln) amidotransferase subunit GatC [Bacteroidia bacterium]